MLALALRVSKIDTETTFAQLIILGIKLKQNYRTTFGNLKAKIPISILIGKFLHGQHPTKMEALIAIYVLKKKCLF